MRTVLTLDEDAADILRAHAERRGVSMGAAASDLIRKGSRQRDPAGPAKPKKEDPARRSAKPANQFGVMRPSG